MNDEKFMIGEWDEGWRRRCQTIEENEIDIIIQDHLMKVGNEYEINHWIKSKIKWNETIIDEMIDKKLIKLIFIDYFIFVHFYFILIKIKKMKRRMKDDEETMT